ncbi:MAG: hypothetical protein EP330_24890 [Deltaproteobacteria bacterium]|nr:MAG: hypothetical protein EP330_24890 [Deltaproteobacteria bacterium]
MTLFVRIASTEQDPGAIQGHVRTVTREIAAALRPDLPFLEAMSSRKGWDMEGVAGQRGVGARASYIEDQRTQGFTLRAVWADDEKGEQEWSVETDVSAPAMSPEARRRGQLIVLAAFHGAAFGAFAIWAVLTPLIETTGTILAVMAAPFLGVLAGAVSARFVPAPPPPPDPQTLGDAWTAEVRAAVEAHPSLTVVEVTQTSGS